MVTLPSASATSLFWSRQSEENVAQKLCAPGVSTAPSGDTTLMKPRRVFEIPNGALAGFPLEMSPLNQAPIEFGNVCPMRREMASDATLPPGVNGVRLMDVDARMT